jgi:hypothetical protein
MIATIEKNSTRPQGVTMNMYMARFSALSIALTILTILAFPCNAKAKGKAPASESDVYAYPTVETDETSSGVPGVYAYPTVEAVKRSTEILKTVTIRGTLSQSWDEHGLTNWVVSVGWVGDAPDFADPEARLGKYAVNAPTLERKISPVAADGSFKIVIHNAPVGGGYHLLCGHKSRLDSHGLPSFCRPFEVRSAEVYLDVPYEVGD